MADKIISHYFFLSQLQILGLYNQIFNLRQVLKLTIQVVFCIEQVVLKVIYLQGSFLYYGR